MSGQAAWCTPSEVDRTQPIPISPEAVDCGRVSACPGHEHTQHTRANGLPDVTERWGGITMTDEINELIQAMKALYKRLDEIHKTMAALYEKHGELHLEGEEVMKQLKRLQQRMNELKAKI